MITLTDVLEQLLNASRTNNFLFKQKVNSNCLYNSICSWQNRFRTLEVSRITTRSKDIFYLSAIDRISMQTPSTELSFNTRRRNG